MADQKKSKKCGRSLKGASMALYKAEFRSLKNKVKKMNRHLKKHPNDAQCLERVSRDWIWYKRKKTLDYFEQFNLQKVK